MLAASVSSYKLVFVSVLYNLYCFSHLFYIVKPRYCKLRLGGVGGGRGVAGVFEFNVGKDVVLSSAISKTCTNRSIFLKGILQPV